MTNLSNEEIDALKAQPKTELEKTYEHGLLTSKNKEIHNIAKVINFLSSMKVEDAMKETYSLIQKRLTIFMRSIKFDLREKIITEIKIIAKDMINFQTKAPLKTLSKNIALSREHRTILNHFAEAFQEFNFALRIATAHLEIIEIAIPKAEPEAIVMALFLSLQCLYKGDMRLIRESADPDRKQLAKNASTERSKHYTPAQVQTCILLKEFAPKGGWTSKPQAAKVIASILEEFLTLNKISTPNQVTPGNVQRRVRNWLDTIESIQMAYLENCSTANI
ncbi:hypothetical protein HX882_17355 [Pseudomonas gingeri]|uniref:Uncharacterized protein n=1 Tax=Pseudomonas gingeri TaxID=117681 RepID=A0A7Y8C3U4_9PSED|nr:hypothetical protein [Pseudomonas gingeri]NWB51086.1 hypothetical protein [Pseudomonas gingeri]NWB97667.1 hypothetical protein [Pseudomonas gingeri]